MTIAISCTHCGQRYAVDERAAGKSVTCRQCSQKFVAVAMSEEEEMQLAPDPAPAPVRVPAPRPAARPAQPAARPAQPAAAGAVAAAFGGMSAPPRQNPLDLSDLLDDNIKIGKSQDEDEGHGHGPALAKKKKKKKKKSSGGGVRGNEASRLMRWLGNFLDGVFFVVFMSFALMLVLPSQGPGRMSEAQIKAAVIGMLTGLGVFLAVWLALQGALITLKGQSLGKLICGTQIVNEHDNELPGFVRGVLVRSWIQTLLCFIPLYALIDAIYIFEEDRRCLHDHIAGTRVISIR